MHDSVVTGIVSILTAVIGVAIIAVVISKQANTAGVLTAGGTAFSGILNSALSPVTGGANNSGGLTLPSLQ